MRKKTTISVIAAAGLALALAVPTAAWAANYNLSGTLNTAGGLVTYDTFRPHANGPAGLNITKNVVGGGSAFGLRNGSGVQVTTSRSWNTWGQGNTGYKPFASATTLLSTIPAGSYAVNGRMIACCSGGFFNISWDGILTQ